MLTRTAGWAVVGAGFVLVAVGIPDAVVLCACQRSDGTFHAAVIREVCKADEVQLGPRRWASGAPREHPDRDSWCGMRLGSSMALT